MSNEKFKVVDTNKVHRLLAKADVISLRVFDNTQVVTAKLPNGFVISKSFSFADAKHFDEQYAENMCMTMIYNEILVHEAYYMCEKERQTKPNNKKCDKCCNNKPKTIDDDIEEIYKNFKNISMSMSNEDTKVRCEKLDAYFGSISEKYHVSNIDIVKKIQDYMIEKETDPEKKKEIYCFSEI